MMRLQEEEQQGEQKMHQTAGRDSGLFLQKLTFKVTLVHGREKNGLIYNIHREPRLELSNRQCVKVK